MTRVSSRLSGSFRAVLTGVLLACAAVAEAPARAPAPPEFRSATDATYATLADDALAAMLRVFYAGRGMWRDCPDAGCWIHNGDWGSDSLTNTLYLRWRTARDPNVPPVLRALAKTARLYDAPCRDASRCGLWSDVPLWDSVTASHEADVLRDDPEPRRKAVAAFWAVEGSPVYDVGACPSIRYQRPFGHGDRLKTLETDSNGIKAALLLFAATHDRRYLAIARTRYAAVRRYFLDRRIPLYSVYVIDTGSRCAQIPHRFFASVNGNMIWNGLELARDTRDARFVAQALATARAVANGLADPSGIFTDLQAENDLEEPLVEAMLRLAGDEHQPFARRWLLANAAAALSARRDDGTYGRFFDGPPPASSATAWQTTGGFAAQIAAASLAPHVAVRGSGWSGARFVPHEIERLPASVTFYGSGFALIGTIGEICCQPGHARILVDGAETTNRVGAWQNKSSSGQRLPGAVLFAWRWPAPGVHRIDFEPGIYDPKEGGSFLHASGYALLGTRSVARE